MKIQSLSSLLYTNFNWHPARIATFAEIIFGVVKTRTVKIKELALDVVSKGKIKAKIAKVERFFSNQDIDYVSLGKTIYKILNINNKVIIAIDRTNWKFGKQNINYLVTSIVYKNISIPIAWQMLDKKGNSNTQER
jgi:hypothetical protein